MDKYQNKYRIPSTRLQSWNYGWNAPYFVTICTANRKNYFGHIVEKCRDAKSCVSTGYAVLLSEIGEIACQSWVEIPCHFPFVQLDEFVVMPNHVHGIIIIAKPDDGRTLVETQDFASLNSTSLHSMYLHSASLPSSQKPSAEPENRFGPQSKNLASIIRGFKIGVKKYATMNKIKFAWQPRFYDHIIRNAESYYTIQEYIKNNPMNWISDKLYEE